MTLLLSKVCEAYKQYPNVGVSEDLKEEKRKRRLNHNCYPILPYSFYALLNKLSLFSVHTKEKE